METMNLSPKDSYESPAVLASQPFSLMGVICASVVMGAESPSYDVSDDEYNW